jgi:hypothetical protein
MYVDIRTGSLFEAFAYCTENNGVDQSYSYNNPD